MTRDSEKEAADHEFEEVDQQSGEGASLLSLDDLSNVKLRITAELGVSRMLVREILELSDGSIVALNKMAGELTDLKANDLPLARGEVVVIGDALHVRISEIMGANELADEFQHPE